MKLKERLASALQNNSLLGLYRLFGGLSEFWAFIFGAATIYLALKGKLDGNFALAVTAITGILTAHDALDDWHSRHRRDQQDPNNAS
jgi:hypothetical protein